MVAQEFLVLSVGVRIPAGLPLYSNCSNLRIKVSTHNLLTMLLAYSPGSGGRSKGLKVGGGGGGGGKLSNTFSLSEAGGGELKTSPRGTPDGVAFDSCFSSAKGSKGAGSF